MKYTVEKGVIYSGDGLPWTPRWFCDGRMAFEADNQGISEIDYFGPETRGSYMVFKKRFWDGMRFYLNDRGNRIPLKPQKCEILPFGFRSESDRCSYGIYTAGERIFLVLRPELDCELDAEFYEDSLFRPETHEHKGIGLGGGKRDWTEFALEEGELRASFTENGSTTRIAFSANTPLAFRKTPRNTKYILSMKGLKKGGEYVLAFSASNAETQSFQGYEELLKRQFERYEKVAERAPVLKSPRDMLNRFFALAPMYHEALKIPDVPGAMRAQSTRYWVWGWDSMTSPNACFYWGDREFMGEMLSCFEKHAHPEYGIAHAFDYGMEMTGETAAPPPAQGMYLTLLDYYRLSGGAYEKYYPFAKKIAGIILAAEVRDTGLCAGTSLYPDHRALIRETGRDISAFNNTVSYCAVRSMERMAAAAGDGEMCGRCKAFGDRTRKNFGYILYNEALGFLDSSADADTFEKRNIPSNNAVKWENNYCADLMEEKAERYLEFYEKHLVSPAGLRPLPQWHACYDTDANQLHCWWIVMSEFFVRLVNRFGRKDLMEQYLSWVEYWSERLMCPEGIPCYDNDAQVPFDNWNCRCGIWHGYSIRGFYNAIVHAYVGVDFDEEGLNIHPYSGEELELENLHFGERSFHIRITGRGREVERVILNGTDMGKVTVIPYDRMELCNRMEIVRSG